MQLINLNLNNCLTINMSICCIVDIQYNYIMYITLCCYGHSILYIVYITLCCMLQCTLHCVVLYVIDNGWSFKGHQRRECGTV